MTTDWSQVKIKCWACGKWQTVAEAFKKKAVWLFCVFCDKRLAP